MDDDKLYLLKLHEGFTTNFGCFIMRVPGGWIYDCWDSEKDCMKKGLFVPYNSEFDYRIGETTTMSTKNTIGGGAS